MDTRAKKAFYLSKFVILVALFIYVGLPTNVRSQETTGSSSAEPQVEPQELDAGNSLTEWWLTLFMGEPGEDSDPTHVETFDEEGELLPDETAVDVETTTEDEINITEADDTPRFTPLPSPPLKTRRYGVEIFPDLKADHSCEAETLRTDLTEQSFAFRKIFLETYPGFSYSLEVGSLPDGIDVVFSETKIHLLHTDTPLTEATVEISRQDGARKGDFSIPLIFIERGETDSAFICQLNIVNR